MSHVSSKGPQLAQAAASFIGVRFRLLGRDHQSGLDCIGLVTCSLTKIGCKPVVPTGYRFRNSDASSWLPCATSSGLIHVTGSVSAGDVLLLKPGPGQHHLVIAENSDIAIHAHAGLRRVVRQPMGLFGEVLAHWRLP